MNPTARRVHVSTRIGRSRPDHHGRRGRRPGTPQRTSAVRPSKSVKHAEHPGSRQAGRGRKTAPPLPAMGFAPVRPMDIVRATYDFAAQHPEDPQVRALLLRLRQPRATRPTSRASSRVATPRATCSSGTRTASAAPSASTSPAKRCSSTRRAPTSCRFAPQSKDDGRRATPPASTPTPAPFPPKK